MNQILGDLVFTVTGNTFAGRVYPGEAPFKPTAPFAVYGYFGTPNTTLQGKSDLQPQRLQYDVYADTYRAAEQLALDVAALMVAQTSYGSPSMFSATHVTHQYFGVDPDVKLHRVMLEFSCWYRP